MAVEFRKSRPVTGQPELAEEPWLWNLPLVSLSKDMTKVDKPIETSVGYNGSRWLHIR